MLRLLQEVLCEEKYKVTKHVEIKPARLEGTVKPIRRWHSVALTERDRTTFLQRAESRLAHGKKHTIFVDNVVARAQQSGDLAELVASHVRQNLVKIGKKFYRQKNGIPQGSVLSSMLCNYFYADLEKRHLSFLTDEDCLLSRLIDDFLLITTDIAKASKFVEMMHQGFPEYGVSVSPVKTLVNFDLSIQGSPVQKVPEGHGFPYCGTLIDCQTLNVGKDRRQPADFGEQLPRRTLEKASWANGNSSAVAENALTVEFGRTPGQNFTGKVLSESMSWALGRSRHRGMSLKLITPADAFRLQSHVMFYDTGHNSTQTVMRNLFEAFVETTTKMWAYARCLPTQKQPGTKIVIGEVPVCTHHRSRSRLESSLEGFVC